MERKMSREKMQIAKDERFRDSKLTTVPWETSAGDG